MTSPSPVRTDLASIAADHGVDWLILHGSRARGDHRAGSDWDFAYAGAGVDHLGLLAALTSALGTEAVDLSNVQNTSILFQYRVIRDGDCLFEAQPGMWQAYMERTAITWCDMEPVLTRAYAARLAQRRDHGV